MKSMVKTLIAVVVVVGVAYLFYKHSGFFLYEHNPMQYMPNMHHTKELKPQRGYSFFPDGSGARVPPEGSLARDQVNYPHKKEDYAGTIEKKSNPLPITKEVVLRGQKVFMNNCVVCHGPKAEGNGLIVPPYPAPPSLQSEKIRGYADSQIFHIITVGQNIMPPYGPQIREEDRWAVIHYLRVLQKAENPSDADVKAFEDVLSAPAEGENKK